MGSCYSQLSYAERMTISDDRESGNSLRQIARRLNRSPATISRELRRDCGRGLPRYDPCAAGIHALRRRRESGMGRRKLRPGTALFDTMTSHLREG